MNFLKENKFLVVTAAVLLVLAAASLLIANSLGGKAEIGAKAYASMGKTIDSLASEGVNRSMVNTAKQRVQDMRDKAKKVAEESLLRNRRNYEVLSFDISGNIVPAFPIDPEFKDRGILKLWFPEKYRLRLKAIRETLKPTIPPTDNEIQLALARIAASVMPKKEDNQPNPVVTPAPRASERNSGMGIERHSGMGVERRSDMGAERRSSMDFERRSSVGSSVERGATGRMTGTKAEQSAVGQQALINLVISKSEQGWIYADKEPVQAGMRDRRSAEGGTSGGGAMYNALPLADYDDDALWMAQVGLWVQQDIVDAINLTNRQVQSTASGGQRGVAASAIKRLMNIEIRGYVLGGSESGVLQYLDVGDINTSRSAPQLTGRACNKLYDVVHYEFTVILPMQHLLRLQKNLMAQNHHTILEVDVNRTIPSDMHYYGTDSVMTVTIVGEMLMLTDFTRGRWDKDAKDWDENYPPLTPATFLEKMREMDAEIVREEDKKRLRTPTVPRSGSRFGGGERHGRM
ncbi:MAG: hypothetical protein SVV80_01280 [Planctomycetota bacterium]|nr:hypothetical protein [Planctomycetota bacterium]